jgi:hypothetical protein
MLWWIINLQRLRFWRRERTLMFFADIEGCATGRCMRNCRVAEATKVKLSSDLESDWKFQPKGGMRSWRRSLR